MFVLFYMLFPFVADYGAILQVVLAILGLAYDQLFVYCDLTLGDCLIYVTFFISGYD